MKNFMKTLVGCAEKAAGLARACRKEEDLFQLLVEEKKGDQKNANFSHDFKTLADVLIQETVRHDIGQTYPRLADYIFGEESNEFTNTLGEKILVRVCDCQMETSDLLCKVLDGRKSAADILARVVHATPQVLEDDVLLLDQLPDEEFDVENLGIWIDPIDGTNNYISDSVQTDNDLDFSNSLETAGLAVVTVLIGVFNKTTGQPLAGVINQPFVRYSQKENRWYGRVHWGLLTPSNSRFNSLRSSDKRSHVDKKKIVLSMNEKKLSQTVTDKGFEVFSSGGAGYKILCVILGQVDFYITLRPSTYMWDSCAGHAILMTLCDGTGGCVEVSSSYNNLRYIQKQEKNDPDTSIEQFCNSKGLIAFRSRPDLERLLEALNPLELQRA